MVMNSMQELYDMEKSLTDKFSALEREYENTPGLSKEERDVLLEDGLDTHYGIAAIRDVIQYIES